MPEDQSLFRLLLQLSFDRASQLGIISITYPRNWNPPITQQDSTAHTHTLLQTCSPRRDLQLSLGNLPLRIKVCLEFSQNKVHLDHELKR